MKKFKVFINPEKINFSKKLFENSNKWIKLFLIIKNPEEEIPQIKTIFNKNWLITLHFEDFDKDINSFGYIIFKIGFPNTDQVISWVLPKNYFKTIEDAYLFFKDINAKVIFINNNISPISQEQIKKEIQNIEKKLLKEEKKTKKETIDKNLKKEEERKRLVKFIDEIIKDTQKTIQKSITAFPTRAKNLQKAIDELAKLKRSTNIEKINFLLEQIITESEKLELELLQKEKISQHLKAAQDSLSDLEIILEHEKLEKSKKILQFKNIHKTLKEQIYGYLWKSAVSISLFIKDFNKKIKYLNKYINYIKDFWKLIAIIILVYLAFLILFSFYIKNQNLFLNNIYYLTTFGIFSLLSIIITKFYKKPSVLYLLYFFIGTTLSTYLLSLLIKYIFAF